VGVRSECGKVVDGLSIATLTGGFSGTAGSTKADDVRTMLDRFHDGAKVRALRGGFVLSFAIRF
jgi:hypothetical protein